MSVQNYNGQADKSQVASCRISLSPFLLACILAFMDSGFRWNDGWIGQVRREPLPSFPQGLTYISRQV